MREKEYRDENERMIEEQIVGRGVRDPRVIDAFRQTPRELFVSKQLRSSAYDDNALPIEHGQTISQPYIVAFMTELLHLRGDERVLELGTGSGYQTAILARLAKTICSAELEAALSRDAAARIARLGISNAILRVGDGVQIFRSEAPFDAILSAAAPAHLPEELLEQLGEGGRCVIPVGGWDDQYLWLIERHEGKLQRKRLDPVRFVPLR